MFLLTCQGEGGPPEGPCQRGPLWSDPLPPYDAEQGSTCAGHGSLLRITNELRLRRWRGSGEHRRLAKMGRGEREE
jgi:hypothetical protein